MSDGRRILIHIGTHKTGSTSIQQFLARAADRLCEDGILYPDAGRPDDGAPHGHHVLAWSIQKKRGLEALEGWDEVVNEVKNSSASQVVLSSEVFETCTVAQVRQIRSFFPEAIVEALVYLRDPLDYMVSMYKQHIKAWGECRTFRQFVETKKHLCDYPALIRRWEQGLGKGCVVVRSFDQCRKEEGLEASLLGILGLRPDDYKQFVSAPANVSPTDERIVVARWLNRMQEQPWISKALLHRVKRNVLRGTWRGRWLTRVVQGIRRDILHAPEEVEWFQHQIRLHMGSVTSPVLFDH